MSNKKYNIRRKNSLRWRTLASASAFIITILPLAMLPVYANGGTNIIEAASNMMRDLAGNLLGISSAAAVAGVGIGALFKMFSLGKQDRIETGNKIMVNSIWGWVLVNGATYIFQWAGSYLGDGVVVEQINRLP